MLRMFLYNPVTIKLKSFATSYDFVLFKLNYTALKKVSYNFENPCLTVVVFF